jgi:hypothetical protein
MFRIESEKALLDCFRPIDRSTVAPTKSMEFPLYVRDYFTWVEPSGARTYLVFPDTASGKLLGVSFRRDQPRGASPYFCEWCHSVGSSAEIGLLTADASERRRVGISACLDLRCVDKLETRSNLTGENARHLARGVIEKMSEFARKSIF